MNSILKNLSHLIAKGAFACALALLAGCASTSPSIPPDGNSGVTAIDILLEPDATMLIVFDKTLESTAEEYAKEKNPAAEVRTKWAEVQMIALAFRLRQDPAKQQNFESGSKNILNAESVKFLQTEKPAAYAGLELYRDAVAKLLR